MKIKEIRTALEDLILPLVEGAKILRTDVPKPAVRPSFKIDVLPVSGGAACDECDEVAEQLLDALGEGFAVGGVWLPLDDTIEVDTSQGVLVAQFGVSWVETAAETGEYMETLNYNGEELTT